MMQANVTFRGCLVAFLCAFALALCFIVPAERERLARLGYAASRLGIERRELAAGRGPFGSCMYTFSAPDPRCMVALTDECLYYEFYGHTAWAREHAAAAPITAAGAERIAVAVMVRYLGARSGAVAIRSTDFDETRRAWVVAAVLGEVEQKWVGPYVWVGLSAFGQVREAQAGWRGGPEHRAGTGR